NQIQSGLEQIAADIPRQAIVTDVASVKRPVLAWARSLPDPSRFLGGHPVAGKERSGLSESDATLFRGETWVFTPDDGQELTPFDEWFRLVRAIGARPQILSADAHDRQMAFLSHLAFTLSLAYAQTVRPFADPRLGGPGYRGMVRLAEGDPTLYEDITATNRGPLVEAIDRFADVLHDYRERIDHGDSVGELFTQGARAAHLRRIGANRRACNQDCRRASRSRRQVDCAPGPDAGGAGTRRKPHCRPSRRRGRSSDRCLPAQPGR